MTKEKMYSQRVANISVFRGCDYSCIYCAFRTSLRRSPCEKCRTFEPHAHLEVLEKNPPKTKDDEFITIGLTGDISFMDVSGFWQVIEYCRKWKDRTFLIQSKNPAYFLRFQECIVPLRIPDNVILGCYSEDVRVVTPEGFKTHKELKEGDTVFTLNPITKEIECATIEKLFVYNYKGEMYRFRGRRFNLLVTPNHRMLIHNRSQKRKIILSEAMDVAKLALFHIPSGIWNIPEIEEQLRIDGNETNIIDVAYLIGIFIGDGCQDIPNTKHIRKDGTLKISHSPRIYLCIPEKDKARQKVINVLSRCGIKYHLHPPHIYFSSVGWYEIFEQCGIGVKNKTIPRWLLNKSSKVLKPLYDGIMDSDGNENRRLVTTSLPLLSEFSELCTKLGKFPHITEVKTAIQQLPDNRTVHNTTAYRVSVSDTEFTLRPKNVSIEQYNGVVWCCSVGKNKNLLIESNGTSLFCGNSTIETNRERIWNIDDPLQIRYDYQDISGAPLPEKRYEAMLKLNCRKAVTIEPIMDFDLTNMVEWIQAISPEFIYIGYDSRPERNHLPEPPLEKTQALIEKLGEFTEVRTKYLRKAWGES